MTVGYAVDTVNVLLDQPREQLDQRDPRIVNIVIGPRGRVARDQRRSLLDQVRPVARVEIGKR
jgi:hypothetical protein